MPLQGGSGAAASSGHGRWSNMCTDGRPSCRRPKTKYEIDTIPEELTTATTGAYSYFGRQRARTPLSVHSLGQVL